MHTMILESLLALGLCIAAALIFAVSDLYHELQQRRQQRLSAGLPARVIGSGVRFGGLLQQLALCKSGRGKGLPGH
jgi:hypothetical protein